MRIVGFHQIRPDRPKVPMPFNQKQRIDANKREKAPYRDGTQTRNILERFSFRINDNVIGGERKQ